MNNIDYNSNNFNLNKKIINNKISNEDIVNIGNASSNIILNNNSNSINNNNNKSNTIEISNTNYIIQKDKKYFPKKEIIEREDIVQNDYNYFYNENEVLNSAKSQKIIQNENIRYAEDDNINSNSGAFPLRRSKTISKYKNLFKSKSKEKMNIDKNIKHMNKSNSEKVYELLRDFSFEQNNYN